MGGTDLLDPATPEDILDLSRRKGKWEAWGNQQVKKAEEEPGRAWGGQPACCGVAGRQTRRQERDVSVGEAGFWLVGTRSSPQVMNAMLGGRRCWATGAEESWGLEKGESCPTSFFLTLEAKDMEFGDCP